MPRSVKLSAKSKRTTIDWKAPVWQGLEAAAKAKAAEAEVRITPTHIIRIAVDRYLDSLRQAS
jgi:hypothetical protein